MAASGHPSACLRERILCGGGVRHCEDPGQSAQASAQIRGLAGAHGSAGGQQSGCLPFGHATWNYSRQPRPWLAGRAIPGTLAAAGVCVSRREQRPFAALAVLWSGVHDHHLPPHRAG